MHQYPSRIGPIPDEPSPPPPPPPPGYGADRGFAESIIPGGIFDFGSTPIQALGQFANVPDTTVWISFET